MCSLRVINQLSENQEPLATMQPFIAAVYGSILWHLCIVAASRGINRKMLSMQIWFQNAGNAQAESLELIAEATIGDLERGIRHAMSIDDDWRMLLSFGGKDLPNLSISIAEKASAPNH